MKKSSLVPIALAALAFLIAAGAYAQPASRANSVTSFDLSSVRAGAASRDAALAVYNNTIEVIETFLYGENGKKAAAQQGRRMWTDPATFQITIVDSPERIRQVSDFIRSLPQTRAQTRQVVVPVKQLKSDEMAAQLNEVLETQRGPTTVATAQGGEQRTIRLRRGQDAQFRDLQIRLRRVLENDADDDTDDSCELVLRIPTETRDETITEFMSVFFGDYEIVADDIRPRGTTGDGSVRLIVRYIPPATP